MSLLDDARRLANDCPSSTDRGGRGECHYCLGGNYAGGYLSNSPTESDFRHTPDCPWLSLPKIAAALEAASAMIEAMQPSLYAIPARVICHVCHSEGQDWSHTDACTWERLREALDA